MIVSLRFNAPHAANGRLLRSVAFAPRSTLPSSAICLTANGVCGQMKRLFAHDFEAEVVEPIILDSAAREVLFKDALIYRVRGRLCDVFLVLRSFDACSMAAAAFGETERPENAPLSDVEKTTLERVFAAIAPLCAPLCGEVGSAQPEQARRAQAESVTYFEIRLSGASRAAVGFSLTKDPPEEPGACLRMEDLRDVEIEARAECARGDIPFSTFASLDFDAEKPLFSNMAESGVLRFGDTIFARGSCGMRGQRRVFMLGER